MRDPENIREVASLRPDYMGFIFYPPSPRYCGNMPEDVVRSLPQGIMPVAVTVDKDYDSILDLVEVYGFRGVQLHGDESPELCLRLKSNGLFVMKAISVSDAESLSRVNSYHGAVDLLVLDTASKTKGGSGVKFNWSVLRDADIKMDFLLSGGIGPDDAEKISKLNIPHKVGVDLNSRFEESPGIKSMELLKTFMSHLRV